MTKMIATEAPVSARHVRRGAQNKTVAQGEIAKRQFVSTVLTMSWQLAVVVLVPIIGGVELGKALNSKEAYTFVGLAVAVIGSAAVMRRAMLAANRLPVPKLSARQKRAIQKAYEEDDD